MQNDRLTNKNIKKEKYKITYKDWITDRERQLDRQKMISMYVVPVDHKVPYYNQNIVYLFLHNLLHSSPEK